MAKMNETLQWWKDCCNLHDALAARAVLVKQALSAPEEEQPHIWQRIEDMESARTLVLTVILAVIFSIPSLFTGVWCYPAFFVSVFIPAIPQRMFSATLIPANSVVLAIYHYAVALITWQDLYHCVAVTICWVVIRCVRMNVKWDIFQTSLSYERDFRILAESQKAIDIEDDKKLLPFFDKRMSQEVSGDSLGDEFKGYKFRISGGNDKQGFAMMQGVLCPDRVRLLLRKGSKCYRQRRTGEMKRKSVRGCIVQQDLSVLNLVVVAKGPQEIPGLTDESKPVRLGPKRATKIRKLFNLTPEEDVRKFVVRRKVTTKTGKEYTKAPKIQRLITPQQLSRKRHRVALKRGRAEKNKKEQAAYLALVAQRAKEAKERRHELLMKRRSSHGSTHSATKA